MKKININKYPEKWKEFLEKNEYTEAVNLYYKFCRSFCLEKYIYKYGKEEGEKIYNEKKSKIKYGIRLNDLIKKYGEIEGRERYENWKKAVAGNKENFIRRHGDKAIEKFEEFKKKCIIKKEIRSDPSSKYNNRIFNSQLQFYKDKGLNEEEAKEKLSERQTTSNLENLIKKYGEKIGKEKYFEYNKRKINNLQNFIERYGQIDGVDKFEKYKDTLKIIRSKEYLIKKHGFDWYSKFVNRKVNYFGKNTYSKISFYLFEKIVIEIGKYFEKIYYGEKEYTFYFRDKEFSLIKPDFYIKDINYCIEFYGDFWHKNPNIKKYNDSQYDFIRERDKRRIKTIEDSFGVKIDIVWESDYRENPEKTIKEIIDKIIKIKNGNF